MSVEFFHCFPLDVIIERIISECDLSHINIYEIWIDFEKKRSIMKMLLVLLLIATSSFASVLNSVKSQYDVNTTINAIVNAIESKKGFGVFNIVDHQKNAQNVGLEMNAMKVIIFGNPNGGTPLMNLDTRIAYDLPLRIMAFEDANKQTWVAYKEPLELYERYDVNASPIVANVSKLLKSLALINAGENDTLILADEKVSDSPELVQMKSRYSVDETVTNLTELIGSKAGLGVFGVVDHLKNAQKVGLTQPSAKVIFFGNAKAGTPLMLQDAFIGYELPLKIMVFEDSNSDVWMMYKNPHLYSRDFGITNEVIPSKMANLLATLSKSQGSLDFTSRTKKASTSMHALDDASFTLEKDGSILLKYKEAFIQMKEDTQLFSGFTYDDNRTDISYPHAKLNEGAMDITLDSNNSNAQIRVNSSLNTLVFF